MPELPTLLPLTPTTPTLNLGSQTGTYNASGFTRIAASAIVTGDTTDKILGLQVRIDTPGSGTLGVVNGTSLQTTGTVGKIKYDYLAATKLLRLTDISSDLSAIGSDFQAVLRNVAISGATSSVSISANLGKPVYRSENGHYYEFVSVPPVGTVLPAWTASKAAAEASTFLGLQGYLASVTSAQENAFLTATFDSRGWIGAQADSNRKWTWVGAASPENGKSFWIGDVGGTSVGTDLPYSNWDTFDGGEPNNLGSVESYVQFTTGGRWNDLRDTPIQDKDSRYNPDGYWIEYSEAAGTNNLGGTRGTILLTPGSPGPSAPDLVFYDPAAGKVSFAFVGANNTIVNEGLTGDTPLLTNNTNATAYPGYADWLLVSAKLDVDNDGIKDTLFTNKNDGAVAVLFGAVSTGTTRENGFRSAAFVTSGETPILPRPVDGWSLEFASSKIGVGGTPGVFWRNSISGQTVIWTLSAPIGGNTVTANILVTKNVGGNSGWKALGDGEFTQDTTTREIFWLNSKTNDVATWSLGSDRTGVTSKFALATGRKIPPGWNVTAIGNVSGVGNDNVIWQNGTTVLSWNMKDGVLSTTGIEINTITITAADRVKGVFDTDGDGILDLVAQNDGNGTIASYSLTANFALKNTSTPRTQYASNNVAGYRPAKGGLNGSQLELVNVAQYGA